MDRAIQGDALTRVFLYAAALAAALALLTSFAAPARADDPCTGTISGRVWWDMNGSGTIDADSFGGGDLETTDTPGSGWNRIVDLSWSGGSQTAAVDTNLGTYTFSGLCTGSYALSLESESGWVQTFPAASAPESVTLVSDADTATGVDIDFGTAQSVVLDGGAWQDLDGDGNRTLSGGACLEGACGSGATTTPETGLAGVTMTATPILSGGILDNAHARTTITNATGGYSFTFSPAGDFGSWDISATPPSGWSQDFPTANTSWKISVLDDSQNIFSYGDTLLDVPLATNIVSFGFGQVAVAPDAPTASPATTTSYAATTTIALSAQSGASIFYTTDGSTDPSCSIGTLYTAAIEATSSITIKAAACKSGLSSSIAAFAYTISIPPVSEPAPEPAPVPAAVSSSGTGGSQIYNSSPTAPGYSQPSAIIPTQPENTTSAAAAEPAVSPADDAAPQKDMPPSPEHVQKAVVALLGNLSPEEPSSQGAASVAAAAPTSSLAAMASSTQGASVALAWNGSVPWSWWWLLLILLFILATIWAMHSRRSRDN